MRARHTGQSCELTGGEALVWDRKGTKASRHANAGVAQGVRLFSVLPVMRLAAKSDAGTGW
jgi:hypothetical protein